MALVFMDGFDKYGNAVTTSGPATFLNLLLQEWNTVSAATVNVAAPLSATGFAININAGAFSMTKTLPGNYSRLIGGYRFSSNLATIPSGFIFNDTATNQCAIRVNGTTGTISLVAGAITGTAIATSAAAVTANSTHYLEFDITFGNAGAYQIWLDGVSILSGTGDTTVSANNFANVIGFSVSTGVCSLTIDDFYLFDTSGATNNAVLLTSPRIETQFPTGDVAVQFAFGAGILGSSSTRVGNVNTPAANTLVLRRFTNTVAATLNSISIIPAANSGTVQNRGVVYADSSGVPGSLMSSGGTVVGATSGTTLTLPLTTPQVLAAGTQYWLGYMTDVSLNVQLLDGNNSAYRASVTFASGAPGTAPAMTAGQPTYLIWGNLIGITGNNFDQVNNNPPEGQYSYVYDAVAGHEDLYSFPSLSVPPTAIYAVAVKVNLSKSDAGAKTASVRLKSAATDSAGTGGTALAPGTSYGWMTSHYERDPNGNIAWTQPNLNAAQAGIKVET